jgi:hypothetical protein
MFLAATVFTALGFFGIGTNSNVNFDGLKPGALPPYWSATETHPGEPPHWVILNDRTAPSHGNVFAQVSSAPGEYAFPLAVFDKVICRDGDLSVKFKIDAGGPGKMRTAGIVWRYQDPNDYYLLHFSVDDKNIALFHMENGKAHAIQMTGHDIRPGQWYIAKVAFRGRNIRVEFGNRLLFDAVDDSIPNPGKTGLWTKAGTIAYFDDFRIDKKD